MESALKKVLFTVLFLLSLSANATRFVYQATDVEYSTSFIDADSVVYTDRERKTRSAWLKIQNTSKTYQIRRINVYCPTKILYVSEIHFYDANGQLFLSTGTNDSWQYQLPNTVGEVWANAICKMSVNN